MIMKEAIENLPRISIVTPSYNQAQFLERTIISVLNQGYPNLEYIIIDGGSTDKSVEIIKKYEKFLTYWVSEPDKGQSDAINKGFMRTTGEILAWLNSDDMYLPSALFKVANVFKKHPDAALIYGDYIQVDANDRCIALKRQPSFDYQVCMYAYTIAMQPASFFNRKAFFEVGCIDQNLHYIMDYDLYLRIARHRNVAQVKDYLAAFRIHSASKTELLTKLKIGEKEMCKKHYKKYLHHKPLPGEYFLLHWYHITRIYLRMLKEGCIVSRFGKDNGPYKLNEIYRPECHNISEGI